MSTEVSTIVKKKYSDLLSLGKEAFTTAYTSAMTSGDSELIGAYKRMSTLVED